MRSDRVAASVSNGISGAIRTTKRPTVRDARRRRSLVLGAAAIGAVSMLSQRALAANGNDLWVGGSTVNWADANWSGANNPPISGDTLEFNAAGTSGMSLLDNLMTPSTFNVAGITFDATAASFTINPYASGIDGFTLTGNITDSDTTATSVETINDLITLNSATPTVTVTTAGAAVDLGGAIGGTGGLTLSGAGTLALSGTNTFTGGTTIGGGILNINGDAALGAVPGSAATNITFTGASGNLQAGAALVNLNANRNISLTSTTVGATATFETGANYMAINGNITDTAAAIILTKSVAGSTANSTADSGILVLGGNNSFVTGSSFQFTGNTITNDGILRLTSSNALGSNAFIIDDYTQNIGNNTVAITELSGGITIGSNVSLLSRSRDSDDPMLRNISGNNTFAGTFSLVASGGMGDIESADPNGTLTLSGTINTATTFIGAAPTGRTFLLFGNGNGVVSGTVANGAGSIGVFIVGGSAGTSWTFTNAQTFSASGSALDANGGTTVLDFSQWGTGTNMFPSGTILNADGGNVTIKGLASGATSQTFSTSFGIGAGANGNLGGGTTIAINPNNGTSTTLTLPATWTRNAGGTVNFDLSQGTSTSAVVASSPTLTNNIIGGYATVKDSTGIGFATVTSGDVVRYTGATSLLTSGNLATTNYSLATAGATQTQASGGFSVNSLAIDASNGGVLDLGAGTMTITSKGLLMTNATAGGNFTIQDGQVGAAASEVIVQQFGTGTLTISGSVSSGAGSLTKSGPGTLLLTGTNTYTGTTTLNGGVVAMSTDELGASTSAITFAGGTLEATGNMTLASGHTATLEAQGGSFDVVSGATLNYGGAIIETSTGLNGNTGTTPAALTKLDSGTLNLTGTNTYTGGTFINAGTLAIAADASLGSAVVGGTPSPGTPDINIMFTGNSTLQANAAGVSLSANRTVLIDTGVTATLDPQANTFTVGGAITSQSASGELSIGAGNAAGTVALTAPNSSYTIPTLVNSGTLSVRYLINEGAGGGNLSSLGTTGNAASNLILNSGTTLNYSGTTASTDRNFTIATGVATSGSVNIGVSTAATELTMSGGPVGSGSGAGSIGLTKVGAGILAFSGTQTYTGATAISAGTLLVDGSLTSSAVTVAATGTLGGTGTLGTAILSSGGATISPGDPLVNGGVGTLTASSLTLNTGSSLKFDFGSSSSQTAGHDLLNVGSINFAGITGITPFVQGSTSTFFGNLGTYNLIGYTGTVSNFSNLSVAQTAPGRAYQLVNNTGIDEIQLVITAATAAAWNVNGGSTWATGNNWNPNGIPNLAGEAVTFGSILTSGTANVDLAGTSETVGQVIFNDSAAGTSYNITNSVNSNPLVLNNNTAAASIAITGAPAGGGDTISAPITYPGNLNISDTVAGTTLTLSGGLTGSGSLNLQSGTTLQIGSGGSTGSLATGAVNMSSGTTLIFDTTGSNLTLPALLGTGGTLIQNGTNTISLASTGGNTFSSLQVNNGTVDLHGNSLSLTSFSGFGGGTSPGNLTAGVGIITDNSATSGTTTLTYLGSASSDYYGSVNDGATQHIALSLGVSSGTLTLHGASTYSGGTMITEGIISVVAPTNGLGASTGLVTINAPNVSGGINTRILISNGATIANPITVVNDDAGTALGILQALDTTQTTFSGAIIFQNPPAQGGEFVGPATGGPMVISGPVTTGSSIVSLLVRSGNVEFADSTGTSSYPVLGVTGPGTTTLGHSNGISTAAVVEPGLNNAAGIFELNGFNQTVAGITMPTASAATIQNTTGNGILTVNTANTATAPFLAFPSTAPDTYAGLLTDNSGGPGGTTESLALVKTGPGTLLLTGTANSYVGGTTIDAGVLGAAALSSSNNQGSVGFSALVGATNSNVTFATPGVSGILSYTGASAATNQTLVVNSGSIGEFDVATAGTALTWQGELTGSTTPTGFIKGGPGTLIIDGPSGTAFTNNYSGNITVGAGTLVVNGTFGTAGAGATLTLASGATLTTTAGQTSGTIAGSLDHTAGTISIPAASTTLNFSDPLKLDGGSISYAINSTAITAASPTVTTASQGVINAAGGLSYGTSGSEQIGLNFSSTSGLPSTFTLNLLDYSGTLTGTQNLTFTSNLGRASFTPDISTPGELNVDVINGGSATLYWDSTVSSTWDTFASNASPGTANWYNGAKPGLDSFHSGDNVFLAGSGTTTTGGTTTTLGNPLQTSITAASTVTPGSVTDTANSGTSYTISGAGAIAGGAAGTPFLTVSGGGTLTLETANTYAGNTVISNGTLNVGGGTATGSLGTSAVSISNGAELLYNVAAGTTFTNTVTGAGNLVFATVNNANEVIQNSDLSGFTGTLTVQSGILRPANTTNPLNPTNTVGANVVLNGGEIYWDTGSNHAPATAYQITINGTGTGTAGADNDGAIRVGSATNTTLSGPITVGSNSSIGLDGGASLTLTNTNALSGSNVSLSLLGGGTLIVEGNVNLGTTGALAIGTSPVTFAPPVTTDISVSSPITGSAAITINSATTPAASTPSNAGTVTFSSNPGYTGAITINTGDLLISSATSLGTNASGTFITGTGALGVVTGTLQLATTGTTGSPDTIPGTFTLGGHGTAADTAAMITQAHIENISGVNIISGNIVPTTGGDYYDIQSDAGSLTMAGNFAPGGLGAGTTPTTVVYPTASPTGAFRVLQLQGTGNGTWSGTINNGSTAVVALNVGNSNLTPTGGGTWTLSGVNTYTGPTAVFAGTLTLTDTGTIATSNTNAVTVSAGTTANINGLLTGSPQVVDNGTIVVGPADANNDPSLGTVPLARTWTSLAIGTSATVTLPATTGATAYADRTVLVIPGSGSGSGLSFADTTGKLDLGSNDMIVKNAGATGLTSITSSITQGYSGGTWTGTGITSTAAANNSSKLTALGVILNSNASSGALYSSFDGQTVGANDVLVKYTYYGDANLDGVVNGDDYTLIDNGYNAHLSGWENGDFNYSGSVTAADYLLIDNAYQAQTGASGLAVSAGPAEMIASDTDQIASPSPAISAVPEPGTLSLLAIGAAGMLSRRRRRRM